MSANSDTSASGRIYYPGPEIVVTRAYIETRQGRYPVRDLLVENPSYVYAHPARIVALYCGLVEILLAVAVAALTRSAVAPLCAAGTVAAAGLVSAIWVDDRRNPRRMELAAWHNGQRVVLLATRDHRRFEQVRRAVVRTVEANRRPLP